MSVEICEEWKVRLEKLKVTPGKEYPTEAEDLLKLLWEMHKDLHKANCDVNFADWNSRSSFDSYCDYGDNHPGVLCKCTHKS